ncbi:MAG: SDR family NAD(P)-dependent oxidoreductase [Gammaproteobacteria bacterium]|nr:SDR family NAD(P)-dependent oxidoreductase [Gammaproteobacteria bacterium]
MSETRVLVTGASAGLGAEFARQFASNGHDLILVARRTEPMQELADKLHDEYGVAIEILQSDLSLPGAPSRLFEKVTALGLEVGYLVNNAGANGPDLLQKRDWSASQRYIELMMTSVAAMCHHFIPPMVERGAGSVINVASVAGLITVPGDYSYGPTKAYLVAMSKALNVSLMHTGVGVLALCPGFTHTEFHNSEALTKMKRSTPAFIWYDAAVVVREGIDAATKGKDVYISGRIYRFLIPVLRTRLSRWVMSRIGIKRDY